MNQALRTYLDEQWQAVDADVRRAIEVCGGDVVSALRSTLIANAFLIEEIEQLKKQTSAGFVRRKPSPPKPKE